MESTALSQEILNNTKTEILKYLFRNKDKQLTIGEIKEDTGRSRPTIMNFINVLRDLGLVEKKKHGIQYLIEVNTDSPYYPPLKRIMKIDTEPLRKLAEKIAEELTYNYPEIKSIYLFGSVAKGIPTTTSDIDLLIVVDKEDYSDDFEEELQDHAQGMIKKAKVTPSIMMFSKEETEKLSKRKNKLIENVKKNGELLKGKITLEEI